MFKAYLKTLFPLSIPIFFFPKKKEKGFPLLSGLANYRLAFLVTFGFFTTITFSQDTIPRKKIGLVLSGGGAKGFAHIGVLKVLEQAGVKIDYIGGTSMGAVVGGLYASGYNANQLDSIFKKIDFDALIQDIVPRTSKSFYEKRNDEMYAVTLPFENFKVGIPTALSKGIYNYNLLNALTHSVRDITDFNKLPIPFICMATDLETGLGVTLAKGYLPQALAASSAFPTLFPPVEIDGKTLVDGGVSNNYPVDEVRKMGAEIIIGVDVQDDLKSGKSLKDATRILVQISNLQMMERMNQKIKNSNIYIKPDVSSYNVISFNQGEEIIKKGETAAFAEYEKIRMLGSPNFKQQLLKSKNDSIDLKIITISKLKNYTSSYIIGKLGFKQNTKITYNDIKKGLDNINSTQNFSDISYKLKKLNSGDEFILTLNESKNKTFLKFGLHYDDLYKSAALINFTRKKSLLKNDVLSLDIGVGDNLRYNLDYYVDNGYHFSFGLKSRYNQFNKNVATDFNNGLTLSELGINSLNINFTDFTHQIFVQTVFRQKFQIGLGLESKNILIESETLKNTDLSSDNLFQTLQDENYISVFSNIKYDSQDNKFFPRKGIYLSGEIQSYIDKTDFEGKLNPYTVVKADFSFAKQFFKKATIKVQSEIGFNIGNRNIEALNFVFGGFGFAPINNFKAFYGYDFLSLASNSFIKAGATIDYEIFKKNHVNFSANFANIENDLIRNTNWLTSPKYSGYAIGYGIETLIGPIEVKSTYSPETGKTYTLFSVGFWF